MNTVATFLDNTGLLYVDRKGRAGGTILNIGGTLTNSGSLRIGNATLSAPDTVSAASLDNTGQIRLLGSATNQALLDVIGGAGFGAAGVLSGHVRLTNDSAIEFGSGQITSLATDAQLHLNGNDAFIEDSTAPGSNSALTGLASIGKGAGLDLGNGASLSTTGALANDGSVYIDTNAGDGVSSLTAASLDNKGSIELVGFGGNQALLDVTAGSAGFGVAGTLTGFVGLFQDSAIEFLGGQISTIAASSTLYLSGNSAFIEDSTALGSNSALTGLADIEGNLTLQYGASLSTTGALVNNGSVLLNPSSGGTLGGSTLTVAGALTNTGTLSIHSGGISSSSSVTASSFVNSGAVELIGGFTSIDVSGATTNNGSISIGSEGEFAGAVDGAGSFSLYNANLQFDSSVSAGQTIKESGAVDGLTLEQAQNFAATISGFGLGTRDTIDAANFLLSATTFNFVENSGGTGTLTLQDGSLTANILMAGHYTKSDFTLAPDSGTGTLVKFV
jgi:hypothetical protein